jgi:Fe-S cluster biogenesis protein NfuA
VSRELLDRSSKRIETLLNRFSTFPPTTGARTDAEDLVRTISSLYGECLRSIVKTMSDQLGQPAGALLEQCSKDPLVASLLITHGLHPVSLEVRVRRALDDIRPMLHEQDGEVELLSASEDAVELRMRGTADLIPLIEQAVYAAAPEVLEVRCSGQTISLLSMR